MTGVRPSESGANCSNNGCVRSMIGKQGAGPRSVLPSAGLIQWLTLCEPIQTLEPQGIGSSGGFVSVHWQELQPYFQAKLQDLPSQVQQLPGPCVAWSQN